MNCRCGCKKEAEWLITGKDYGPNGKGEVFTDEPACNSAMLYCEESAYELGLPFSKRRINKPEDKQ
jgi:hypothetical protein